MSPHKISIVVCTRNRAGWLPKTLHHYEQVVASVPVGLVVVDNGSTDDTARVLSEFAQTTRLDFRTTTELLPGVSRARNRGWRLADASIVAFSDDDCYPQPDYVDQIWEKLQDPAIGYLGGRVLLYDPDDFPITIQTNPVRASIPPHSWPVDGAIHGANLAARRAALEATGGFDEFLGPGCRIPAAEDVDWLGRASAAGFAGAYEPDVVVLHHHRRRSDHDVKALRRSYDTGRGAYIVKALLDPHVACSRQRTGTGAFARDWRGSIKAPATR